MNTDQGSQYTSERFLQALKDREIQISMDGQGAWRDNIFCRTSVAISQI